MTPAQAVALVFADDTALNLSAFTPHPAVTEAPFAVVSSRDEDEAIADLKQQIADRDNDMAREG